MKKICTYIEIEEACNCPFVSTNEIKIILGGVSKSKADSFRTELEKELDQELIEARKETDSKKRLQKEAACYYFKDTRPHKLPVYRVLQKAHLDLEQIRKEANKMRRALKIERN